MPLAKSIGAKRLSIFMGVLGFPSGVMLGWFAIPSFGFASVAVELAALAIFTIAGCVIFYWFVQACAWVVEGYQKK